MDRTGMAYSRSSSSFSSITHWNQIFGSGFILEPEISKVEPEFPISLCGFFWLDVFGS